MSPTIEEQIERLKRTIAEMESQREALGDEVVQKALEPLLQKLAEMDQQLEARRNRPPEQPQQQRKMVTILFMDIVGSTAIIQHMDPEDVSEIFDLNLKHLAQPVIDYGGRVTSFTGDGFMALFGAPLAREDDPERAVQAGLAILTQAEMLARELEKEREIQDFKVHVGINTGLIILGGETEGADTTKGPAVHLAARLQSAAPPGGVLVSHDTYRYIRGVFDVEPWEPIQVKGFDEPVKVYHIIHARPRAFRVYSRGVEGIETHMVGRGDELKYLQDALLCAIEDGEGQLVTIIGEAGVGKSRLLYEFEDWIELQPARVRFFEGRGRQEAQGLPYGLLRDMFAFRFQIQDDDSAEVVRKKIEQGFSEILGEDESRNQGAHILGQWLGFDFTSSPLLQGVLNDPEQLRNRGLMHLEDYFNSLCNQTPVVIILEDIHWADDSSLDVLNWLGQRMHKQRILVVCAARPTLYERRPYWGEGLAFHHRINLTPLSKRESRELLEQILKFVDEIPPSLRELVVEGAEGNPFYVEELIKMMIEEGIILKSEERWHIEPDRLANVEVPPTLAGVLQARLDSLPQQERTVLQQASVVGRLFWDRIVTYIQHAEAGGEELVPPALSALRERELIYRREDSAFAETREYIFKHDILREVTYESVLKRLRRVYHGLVADWLIAQAAGRMDEYNGLVAEHLLLADRKELACQYFTQAGQVALATYANGEAEANFSKALELYPDIPQRAACLAGLGELLGRRGLRDEADKTLREAINLYIEMKEVATSARLYEVLSQILWHEDYQKAWDACQEGLERLAGAPDSPGLAFLLAEAGRNANFRAQPVEKIESLCLQAIEMSDRLGIVEPKAEASITQALVIPDPKQSLEILHEAAALSEAHGLMRTLARANFNLGYFYACAMINSSQAFKHYMKSAEISRQIGDVDMIFLSLTNALENWFILGDLNSVESFTAEFLQKSSASEAQVGKFLRRVRVKLFASRGDWMKTLEHWRNVLIKLRQGGSIQFIAEGNLSLVDIILELHKFTTQNYLAEAEAAMLENIGLHWREIESNLMLVVILSKMGRLREAHERLDKAVKPLASSQIKLQELFFIRAAAELAVAESDWETAISSFQKLISIFQEGGDCWRWARVLIELGDALNGRNLPGDADQAREVYQQSLQLFTEMAASGYVSILQERLRKLAGSPS